MIALVLLVAIVVTGAGRGIGREIALLAAAEGAKVIVNDPGGASDGSGISAAPAEEVVEEIRQRGGTAAANFESVAEAVPASKIIKQAVDTYGRLDGVVNNAGILRDAIFHRMSIDAFEAVIKVHLMGSFYTSHAAARIFREQESGNFVHFTSTSGLIGNFGQANYAAAKLGIVGLSKSIALDMERFNVRSNCISPFAWSRMIGTIPTETEEEKARVARMQKMSADKIAPVVDLAVADIASAQASSAFPQYRNFDPYSGHAWASGSSPFADGNNQESSSEAVNAWNAVALWAKVRGNTELQNQATWMMSTEANRYSVQLDTKAKIAIAAIPGLSSGTRM